MGAPHIYPTTLQGIFRSRWEVLAPLIACVHSDQPYTCSNTRELMYVFTDLINTEEGKEIVQRWYSLFAGILADLSRLEPIADYADEHTMSQAYHVACAALDVLTERLTQVLLSS
jgi:hypothetical protein